MGRFGGALDLPAHREDDEDLFETSSSISGDSDDEGVEAQEQINQFGLQVAPKTVRRLNSDSLYNMSSMKAELPAKKGLSRYYDGKSQSYACMSEVRCLEDLPKKSPYKKIKSCKSSVDLDDGKQEACPAPAPNSKPSGSSCANLMARNTAATNMLYRPPAIPVNKTACHQ